MEINVDKQDLPEEMRERIRLAMDRQNREPNVALTIAPGANAITWAQDNPPSWRLRLVVWLAGGRLVWLPKAPYFVKK